jgi:oxalate---CoA ligase
MIVPSDMSPSTIRAYIDDIVSIDPHRPAVYSPASKPLAYAGLQNLVRQTATHLEQSGVSTTDRVGVLLPQGAENAMVCLSLMSAAICVPLNPGYTRSELDERFEQLGINALITDKHTCPDGLAIAAQRDIPVYILEANEGGLAGEFSLQPTQMQATRSGGQLDAVPTTADSIALILQTSGSTGRPKTVALSHRNLLASTRNVAASLNLDSADRCLNMLPLYHIGALLDLMLAPLSVGGSVFFGRDMHAQSFFAYLHAYSPTWYQAVPTMLYDIVLKCRREQRAIGNTSLRFCRSVSSPLPEAVRTDFQRYFNIPVVQIYGMTETAGVITGGLYQQDADCNSVGKSSGPDVAILDEAGNLARAGQRGEVIVRGENVFAGYEGSDNREFVNGWFRTGDEGFLDDEGFLYLVGRIKDIINRGGEKISPLEIDQLLITHPAIRDAACFSSPHLSLGEDVAAAIVLEQGQVLTEPGIRQFLSGKLASFKIPHHIFFVESLPRTVAGKLQRHLLTLQFFPPQSEGESAKGAAGEIALPETPREKMIAAIWQEILDIPQIGLHDNFFDLGGDSLSVTEFVAELELRLKRSVTAGMFFDHPTIAEFDQFLSEQLGEGDVPAADETGNAVVTVAEQSSIPGSSGDDLTATPLTKAQFTEMLNVTAAWQGVKKTPDSLLVGFNTLGSKQPIFFGCTGSAELLPLAKSLGQDQPVYGFRSLMDLKSKSPENAKAFAKHYVVEMQDIQPAGDYILGGFCDGGRLAFEMAQLLRDSGRAVKLLFLLETFIARPYDGRVALFYVEQGKHTPYRYYATPEQGWPKYYTGALSATVLPTVHMGFFEAPHNTVFASLLAHEIDCADSGVLSNASRPEFAEQAAHRLPGSAYSARIGASLARVIAPGAVIRLPVVVVNTSNTTWLPTRRSGISLANRWRKKRSGKIKIWRDGRTELTQPLAPGESVTLTLEVCAPVLAREWILEIDLVDEGVCWFQEQGSSPARLTTRVIHGAQYWSLLMSKLGVIHHHAP